MKKIIKSNFYLAIRLTWLCTFNDTYESKYIAWQYYLRQTQLSKYFHIL